MKVYEKVNNITDYLDFQRQLGKRIGFVPTMGALHQGHLSLVSQSGRENDLTVTSIFVNPTQFDNPQDYNKYPRVLQKDIKLLEDGENNILFIPSEEEMYPPSLKESFKYDFGALGHVMEGAYRAGHFTGVGQVVSRLLLIVKPQVLYLGQKDYQQCMIISKLVREFLKLDTAIKMVPIQREPDGLAMSSRNVHLTKEERKEVPILHQVLKEVKENYLGKSPGEWQEWAVKRLISTPSIQEVDYFEIVDAENLNRISQWGNSGRVIACIAVRLKNIRLIDNMFIKK